MVNWPRGLCGSSFEAYDLSFSVRLTDSNFNPSWWDEPGCFVFQVMSLKRLIISSFYQSHIFPLKWKWRFFFCTFEDFGSYLLRLTFCIFKAAVVELLENTDTFSLYKVNMLPTVDYLFTHPTDADAFIWSCPIFSHLSALFWSPAEKN